MRLACLDDDPRVEAVLGRFLRQLRHEVSFYRSITPFKAAIQANPPDASLPPSPPDAYVHEPLVLVGNGAGSILMPPGTRGGMTDDRGRHRGEADASRTLERLAGSEAALREAQAIAHLGSWALDYRSGELVWSDETYRLLGFRPGVVTPSLEVFFSAVHAEDRARVQGELEAARRRSDGSYSVEHRVRGPDGILRVIREKGRVRFNDDGEAQGISGTALDITEQRRVELDLM